MGWRQRQQKCWLRGTLEHLRPTRSLGQNAALVATPSSGCDAVALIVGGGPGTSAACAELFAAEGMLVALAARSPDKPAMVELAQNPRITTYQCDAKDVASVEALFTSVRKDLGEPRFVIHNIDGRVGDMFRKTITEVDPKAVSRTLDNGAYSAFLVAQNAAKGMVNLEPDPETGAKGTILFTNASASLKGFPLSGAFAMASFAKRGLAESIARELGPQGIHVANVPIDAAIGRVIREGEGKYEAGVRAHWRAGESKDDNLAQPERIAELYLQMHKQHRSTWAFEVVLRPWTEHW